MTSKRLIQELTDQKTELTRKLNNRLIAEADKKSANKILASPQEELLRKQRDLILQIAATEAEIRLRSHYEWLSGSRDLDDHLSRLIQNHVPQPAETPAKIRDMLQYVCDVMAAENRHLAVHISGVGSHHDGSKMFRHDEMDFVMISKRRPDVDYNISCQGPFYSILPVEGSDFHEYCRQEGLLDEERLSVWQYRAQLTTRLSSVMPSVCQRLGLYFGGWNRPSFGGFEENGPAYTAVVDGISVDLTLAFRVPSDLTDADGERVMQEAARRIRQRHACGVDYADMGLLVVTGKYNYCDLTATLIETHLFWTVPELGTALQICKVYKNVFFNLPWPDIRPYYRHLERRVFDWIMDLLKDDLVKGEITVCRVAESPHSLALLLMATKARPLAVDGGLLEGLQSIQESCASSIGFECESCDGSIGFDVDSQCVNFGLLHPSLSELLDEPRKELVKTMSFLFKSIILKEWLKNQDTRTIIQDVMEAFKLRVDVCHPLFLWSYDVQSVQSHALCSSLGIDDTVEAIHRTNVEQILSQITTPDYNPPPTTRFVFEMTEDQRKDSPSPQALIRCCSLL